MSTAHRPTWDPAQARDVKGGSRQFSVRDMAAHTKLKFRQTGQGGKDEVAMRDLKAELLAAEADAKNKKRKAAGLAPLEPADGAPAEDEISKRRRLIQEAIALDRDDSDEEEEGGENGVDKGKGKETNGEGGEDGEDDSDEDDEDDTDELLRELEKIKRERAAEKERQEQEKNEKNQIARDEEIATANPLLNLAAALGHATPSVGTGTAGTFSVKRRWDDDRIFQNQAIDNKDKPSGQFINDLLRTEFHRKFMGRFVK